MLIYVNHDDMRSLQLMDDLTQKGYYVSDNLRDMKYADCVYLGCKGIDLKHCLHTHQDTIVIDDVGKMIKKQAVVVTLMHNDYMVQLSKQYDFYYIALLDDDSFLKQNSILTAEGVVSYLISHRRYPLFDSQILVTGYGHCGQALIDLLRGFQCHLSVSVRNSQLKSEIESLGCQYIPIENIDLSYIDILINTIPSVIIEEDLLKTANKNIMIVDIASFPYGIDHHKALALNLNSQILPSIPCRYAYGYASKMICDILEGVLSCD
ncbi:MAG: hypothetical protein LUH02_10910 [Erysipelotrichaceae bacterium]|nr:hypothetical protein [Erysipelotrichaceae bacterium]